MLLLRWRCSSLPELSATCRLRILPTPRPCPEQSDPSSRFEPRPGGAKERIPLVTRTPLSGAELRQFFEPHGHLAYRYTMLWTHIHRFPRNHGLEHCHAICAFEASLLACRVFIDFLGLGIQNQAGVRVLAEKRARARHDDLKVTDLGGEFVDLSLLTDPERVLLVNVYHLANKANAHFTHGAHGLEDASIVHDAVPLIDRLLRSHLYAVVGQSPRGHWHDPPRPIEP